MYQIDLNSDMGESFGAYKIGNDEGILPYVTSANIACGYHAGDPMVMDRVVKIARERGVAVGAHPGYPDLMGFGRRKMVLSPDEVKNYMKYQIGALWAFAHSSGLKLQHVAPTAPWATCASTTGRSPGPSVRRCMRSTPPS